MSEHHLSPAEATRRLGVTIKALRLYERHGLIKPIRAANGYRAYGPAEMARLYQVLALKRLGLPLARIAALLAGRLASLDAILALQEQFLDAEAARTVHALELVRSVRTRLAAGQTLSVDDLVLLTTETTMTAKPEELETIFNPLIEKHFTSADRAEIAARGAPPADAGSQWQALMDEAKRLMLLGDPASPAAQSLAVRWQAMLDAFTGGDAAVAGKVTAVWKDAFADPAAAPKLPASPEMFAFIGKALAAKKATEGSANM